MHTQYQKFTLIIPPLCNKDTYIFGNVFEYISGLVLLRNCTAEACGYVYLTAHCIDSVYLYSCLSVVLLYTQQTQSEG